MSSKKIAAVEADTPLPANVSLPFTDDRSVLTRVFVRNALPREDDYQRWLEQHFDMAYGLGMEQGSQQGDGLTLDASSMKLKVNAAATSGLAVTRSGVEIKTQSGGGLETGSNGVASGGGLKVNSEGISIKPPSSSSGLIIDSNGLAIKTHSSGGLQVENNSLNIKPPLASSGLIMSSEGMGVKLASSASGLNKDNDGLKIAVSTDGGLKTDNNGVGILSASGANNDYRAGAIKTDKDGLWIHVGAPNKTERHGLVGYPDEKYSNALGVDHDNCLQFNSGGQLDLNGNDPLLAIKIMASFYNATHYINSDYYLAFARPSKSGYFSAVFMLNFKSDEANSSARVFKSINIDGTLIANAVIRPTLATIQWIQLDPWRLLGATVKMKKDKGDIVIPQQRFITLNNLS